MTSLTFYGGVGEIGGNKILVEDGKAKIFLDFGQSFSLLDDYFVDWLQPRGRFGLKDYFALNLMPKVKGLYNGRSLERTDLKRAEPEFDGIFISHAHFDHTAHLQYVDERIPIYIGETSKTILESNMETANSFFFTEEEIVKKDKDKTIIPPNEVKTFRTGKEIDANGIKVTPIHVDHSVPGAYGFLVETKNRRIAYTGDYRSHGNKPEMTDDFVDAAEEFEPDLLITEGTRVSSGEQRKNHTEKFVREESAKVADETKGMVLAMRYPKDLDRFRTFYDLAKEKGRTLVISLKTAHLLNSLQHDEKLGLPNPITDKNIQIYAREMKTYKGWEKDMLDRSIDSEWVAQNQKGIIWELDFSQLTELIDAKPKNGACIHSMSEPFEEDPMSQLQDDVLRNWLDEFGMPHHQLHASGHSSKDEVFAMIDKIGAKKLAPVHTHGMDLFPKHLEIERGKRIEI